MARRAASSVEKRSGTIKLRVDKTSVIPYYHQVKLAVRNQIDRGILKPGDMLPSEFCLSEQLGISRLVVHRALRELVTEGMLIRKRAKGTFVSPPPRRGYSVMGPLFSVTESLAKEGLSPQNQILVQEVIPAAGLVGIELRLAEGAAVVHLYNLRLVEALPQAVEDMYFPAARFAELAEMDLNDRSIYAVLDQRFDAHPQEALDIVSAGSATRDEARLLGINTRAPVMRVQRTSTDRQGLPVEFSKVVFHAERFQLVARVRRTA